MTGLAAWRNRIVAEGEEPAGQLLANPRNWRIHPQHQQAAMAGVLNDIGWVQRVIVNRTTGCVVDGHLRVALALSRGESEPVPVVYVELTEAEEAEVLATLDPIAAMAATDQAKLDELLAEVKSGDAAVREMLAGMTAPAPETTSDAMAQIDRAEELNKKWKVALGDLWRIGGHRLLCGDSTKVEDVGRCLGDAAPLLCVTDPPYGVNYDPAWRSEAAAAGHLSYAGRRVGKVMNDDRADWSETWALFPGDVIYSWHPAGATSLVHAAALQGSGFNIRMQIIWAKSNFPIGRGDYHVRHEPCWYAVRKGRAAHRTDDRTQTTLWEISLDRNVDGGHSTQKPLECMARPIRNHDAPEVYDPFLGSGTTMVAAQNLGRRCYGIEISLAYCAVVLERMTTAFPELRVERVA